MNNMFLDKMTEVPTSSTQNGALAYDTTGNFLLDRFSNLNDMFESYEDVSDSLEQSWEENPLLTLRLIMYSRAISRKSNLTELKVKGLGLKNVGRNSLKWLYNNHRAVFHKNLIGIIEIGSYQDIWHKDFVAEWVNNKDEKIISFLANKVLNKDSMALKYLPRHRSNSNIKKAKSEAIQEYKHARNKGLSYIAKYISDNQNTNFTVLDLMKVKSKGEGHIFQRLITDREFDSLDFKTLPGKVLTWITKKSSRTNNTFLQRHNLEKKYIDWLKTQPALKTTSYLYELINPCINNFCYCNGWNKLDRVNKYTIEKQIQTILSQANTSNLNVMPVLDTSGSMGIKIANTTALNIAASLAIYFSMIQSGSFKNSIIAFDNKSKFKKLSGKYLTRLKTVITDKDYMGSTNFQSVIDLVLRTRKEHPEIPVKDYPEVYLVISDLQFDDTKIYKSRSDYTNHELSIQKLKKAGLPEPIFVWYNVSNNGNDNFQNHKNDKGVINISGFDPAVVNRLMSGNFQTKFEEKYDKSIKEISPYEACVETLSQDYLLLFTL